MGSDLKNNLSELDNVLFAVGSLSIYRNILKDHVLIEFQKLLKDAAYINTQFTDFLNSYNSFFYTYVSASTVPFREYIIDKIIYDENPFTKGIQKSSDNLAFAVVEAAAAKDLDKLELISSITAKMIKGAAINTYSDIKGAESIIDALPEWNFNSIEACNNPEFSNSEIYHIILNSHKWSECIENIKEYHMSYGIGEFARFRAFKLEYTQSNLQLKGIPYPDPVRLSDLIGYEAEREVVINNTVQFLKGFKSNNVLLYGDRGTGKSSTVKAILNEYWSEGLRVVEASKTNLKDFPILVELLRNRSQRFIVFVDDLAFEDNEDNYTSLKAVLEGGVESKPDNVLIYATSNRRHLVKEKFSDRSGLQYGSTDDEIRANDSIQEKLSLADRFGITVVFSSPDKKRYLQIVEGLVQMRGIEINKEDLHKEALKWELWYNGRSPRTAKQFVDWLEGDLNIKYHD